MGLRIEQACNVRDLAAVRTLFQDYAREIGVDLSSQGFEGELAGLPGAYASPRGALFLASLEHEANVGCAGLRPFNRPGSCEIKRLYVRDAGRGAGTGRALMEAALAFAAAAGYRDVLLDTLASLKPAIGLYQSLGFTAIPPYWNNVLPDVLYFGKSLVPDEKGAGQKTAKDP